MTYDEKGAWDKAIIDRRLCHSVQTMMCIYLIIIAEQHLVGINATVSAVTISTLTNIHDAFTGPTV